MAWTILLKPLFLLLFALAAALIAAWVFEWINLYRPARRVEGDPSAAGLEFEEVFFMTEDLVRLHGWWIPHPAARGTVVYCHGNAGNISGRLSVARGLHERGVNVLLFDYRGYGLSRGLATEEGTYRDACAAFEVARARHNDAEQPPIVALGASLGGAIAVELARRRPVRGLIVEGGFSSATDVGEHLFPQLPVRWFTRFRYDAAARVPHLAMPKLFVHSREDRMIPFPLGERLFQRAAHPKMFVPTRGEHGEAGWEDNPGYASALTAFLGQVLGPQ
jgi:fermentation-respiration switch protein FrsA (DUF1100 family)